jgi:transcriptional regulator with GAF, ATPase, and Fis domain
LNRRERGMRWGTEKRYKILLEITNTVITNTSRNDFFKTLARELKKHFNHDRLSIFLYDDVSKLLTHFTGADGVQPEAISDKVRPLARGVIANMVIQSQKPVIIKDLTSYADHATVSSMVEAGLKATMAFPLIVRNHILGTLHFSFEKVPNNLSDLSDILGEVSNQIAIAVGNMTAYNQLKDEKRDLEKKNSYLMGVFEDYQPEHFIHSSPAMVGIMKLVESVADVDSPILITGETGTGKDYLARYIHALSSRKNHRFVKVNCPALPSSLIESELFGHAKGAFTGADYKRVGRFEMADKGVIFLDEIAELPVNLQAKLLQVIQEQQFERIGDSQVTKVNFRLIAATNRDLSTLIDKGKFRQDLYYRLNIFQICMPPLRERKEDIRLLIEQINKFESSIIDRPAPVYTDSAIQFLSEYHWPGNIRELKNIIKRIVVLRPGAQISISDIEQFVDFENRPTVSDSRNVDSLAESENQCIKRALAKCRGVVGGPKGAANLLGIPKSTLQYRLKKLRIDPSEHVISDS